LSRKSTCFGHFLCPSSGVFHCIFGTDICHASLMTAFKHVHPDCLVRLLVLLKISCFCLLFLGLNLSSHVARSNFHLHATPTDCEPVNMQIINKYGRCVCLGSPSNGPWFRFCCLSSVHVDG
jgi:hypothetical protein